MANPDPFQEISANFVHLDTPDTPMGALHARQVALVPGADVAMLELELPSGLRGQNREQVARRQLRDRMGLDAAKIEMRPFHDRRNGDKWSRVLVADKGLIEHWRGQAGPICRAVLPEYLALPTAKGLWTIAAGPHGIAIRLGPEDGFGAPDEMAQALLECALRDAATPPRAVLRLGPALPRLEALAKARGIAVITDPAEATAHGLDTPQVFGHGELSFDLRRDPQLARSRLARQVLPWRWPVLFGVVAALLWAASQIVVTERIQGETAQIRDSTRALVQQNFVKTGPVLDVRIQVSQVLARLQAETAGQGARIDPLALFNRAAAVIAAQGAQTIMANFSVADDLTLVLRVTDFAAADRMTAALISAGLQVEAIDNRVSDSTDGVRSELRVAPATEAAPPVGEDGG